MLIEYACTGGSGQLLNDDMSTISACVCVCVCVCDVGERMEAALVRVNLDDDDRENCVVLRVKRRKMQLSTRDCRRTYKFFVCQLNGISLSLSLSLVSWQPVEFYCSTVMRWLQVRHSMLLKTTTTTTTIRLRFDGCLTEVTKVTVT